MKDNFSLHSEQYKKFRPTYPQELYSFLLTLVTDTQSAWDCGTGNGQVAVELARSFQQVYATDISENQLKQAEQKSNITYTVAPAEHTAFPPQSFDLITVAQAVHWFNFDAFYREVKRTLKPKGVLAILGYGLLKINDDVDFVIAHFYTNMVGPYWDKERKYLDEDYRTIPFPLNEIAAPSFTQEENWTLAQLIGYLGTWSAVQHYIKANKQNPLQLIEDDLKKAWGAEHTKTVSFPILVRIGKVEVV